MTTNTPLLPVPAEVAEDRSQTRPADPPDDDPSAGITAKPPSDPPQGVGGKNLHNSLETSGLNANPAFFPSMDVTYYGYRWFDPVTDRLGREGCHLWKTLRLRLIRPLIRRAIIALDWRREPTSQKCFARLPSSLLTNWDTSATAKASGAPPYVRLEIMEVLLRFVDDQSGIESEIESDDFHAISGQGVQPNKWGNDGAVFESKSDEFGTGSICQSPISGMSIRITKIKS